MQNRFTVKDVRFVLLPVVFMMGVLLSSAVTHAQYMRSSVNECKAACLSGGGNALCADSCVGVPAGKSCRCSCSADNLISSDGECTAGCDYGTADQSYCSGGL